MISPQHVKRTLEYLARDWGYEFFKSRTENELLKQTDEYIQRLCWHGWLEGKEDFDKLMGWYQRDVSAGRWHKPYRGFPYASDLVDYFFRGYFKHADPPYDFLADDPKQVEEARARDKFEAKKEAEGKADMQQALDGIKRLALKKRVAL